MSETKQYVFRWNNGIEVKPSISDTKAQAWKFAIRWLRPAGMTDDAEAEKLIRSEGEVVAFEGQP